MRSLHFFLLILAAGLLATCDKSETETLNLDYGYDYFPLEPGREYVYEVDSIVFQETVGGIRPDTSRTFLMERVVDSLLDGAGETVYRIERLERRNAEDPWTVKNIWTASRNARQAFRTEDNLRFIKLIFPVKTGLNWDGNAFVPEGIEYTGSSRLVEIYKGWDYNLLSVDEPATVGNMSFDRVATVSLADFESIIEYRYAIEQYARGVGLIYREMFIADTQCTFCCGGDTGAACQGLSWEDKAEHGFILRHRLISYD